MLVVPSDVDDPVPSDRRHCCSGPLGRARAAGTASGSGRTTSGTPAGSTAAATSTPASLGEGRTIRAERYHYGKRRDVQTFLHC
jgi:hypothetical protein